MKQNPVAKHAHKYNNSRVFVCRKKRSKAGYSKHKGRGV